MEVVDVRDLPHPERPPLVMKMLEEKGELEIIVEVKPVPLIQMLTQKGYSIESRKEDDYWRISIRK